MTVAIALTLALLVLALAAFLWEKVPPDLVALGLFCVLALTGLLPHEKALAVFANPAPITIAAMFVLSAALLRCGALDYLSDWLERAASLPYALVIFVVVVVVAFISAWINNTPVVVVFVPVVLGLARRMNLPASKFLIPLSYAAIFGGTCTLIGTSTNLVVDGIITAHGVRGLSMFELAWLGLPTALVGALYLALAGNRLLPHRETLTAILSEEERREYLTEAFVPPASPLVGRSLQAGGLVKARGFRVVEVVRDGVALPIDAASTPLAAGDRLILACRPSGIARARATPGFDFTAEAGLEQIAAHEALVFEGAVSPRSELIGSTIAELNFRQRYRVIVLAVHRNGRNVREQVDHLALEAGDILLMMGTPQAIEALRRGQDLLLFDRRPVPVAVLHRRIPLVVAAIAAAVLVCLTGCLKPREAYESIEWKLLFLIFGMLALGAALEHTGAARWIAQNAIALVDHFPTGAHKPLVMLACVYLVTAVLTELISNNAVAALMAPIALGIAAQAGLDARPFIIAVTFAASAAFATPIGYQTNTYVYGIGGYRFTDFIRIGLPLNFLGFLVAMLVIPLVWPL